MLKSVVYRVILAVLFLLPFSSPANAYDLLDYFPLTVGSHWVFDYGETEEVIQSCEIVAGTGEIVAGTVKHVWYDDDMGYNIFSYDDNYLYVHGIYEGDESWLYNLNPPLRIKRHLNIGETTSSGATAIAPDSSSQDITLMITLLGLEDVSVPAGVFPDCLHVLLHLSANSPESHWWAYGIGKVKIDDEGEIDVLTSYNIVTPDLPTYEPVISSLTTTPSTGTVPLTVTISCTASDPDGGEIVEYRWDFEDDGTIDTVTSSNTTTHTITTPGSYSISCTVVDDEGQSSSAINYLTVGESPPFVCSDNYNYYLPYFIAGSNMWSGLGLSNSNSAANANVCVFVYNTEGDSLTTESKIVLPRGQDVFVVGQGFNAEGWMKIQSSQPLAGLSFLGVGGIDNHMADIPMTESLSPTLVIPHVAQDSYWDTTIMVANPNSNAVTVALTYVSTDGASRYPVYTITLPAYGSRKVSVLAVVENDLVGGGKVEISASNEIAAFALYDNLKSGGYCYAGINAVEVVVE